MQIIQSFFVESLQTLTTFYKKGKARLTSKKESRLTFLGGFYIIWLKHHSNESWLFC